MRVGAAVVLRLVAALVAASPALAGGGVLDLEPGTSRPEVVRLLADAGLEGGDAGGELVVAGPVLAEVFAAQRALFRFDRDGALSSFSVQVRPDPGSDGREVLRLWDDVRHEFIRTLGPPAWERDEVPPGDPLVALAARRLVKLVQWEDGRTVRLGIPHRIDGDVLVEILVTRDHLARTRLDWGSPRF